MRDGELVDPRQREQYGRWVDLVQQPRVAGRRKSRARQGGGEGEGSRSAQATSPIRRMDEDMTEVDMHAFQVATECPGFVGLLVARQRWASWWHPGNVSILAVWMGIPMKAAWQLRALPPLGNRTSAACSSLPQTTSTGKACSIPSMHPPRHLLYLTHAAAHATMQPCSHAAIQLLQSKAPFEPHCRKQWSDVVQDGKAGSEPMEVGPSACSGPIICTRQRPRRHLVWPGEAGCGHAAELPLSARGQRLSNSNAAPCCDTSNFCAVCVGGLGGNRALLNPFVSKAPKSSSGRWIGSSEVWRRSSIASDRREGPPRVFWRPSRRRIL